MRELKCPDCGHLNPDIRELGYTLPATCGNCPHVWRLQDDPEAIERLKQRFRDDPEFAKSLLPDFSDEDRRRALGANAKLSGLGRTEER